VPKPPVRRKKRLSLWLATSAHFPKFAIAATTSESHWLDWIRAHPFTLKTAARTPAQALGFSVFECCPWCVPEADRQPVVGIHQADRDREIDQFLFLKDRAHGLERFIRHAGL
jgi:hypothetical protein